MRNLRIAVPTITAMLLVVGLTVPFGKAFAESKPHLNLQVDQRGFDRRNLNASFRHQC